MLANGIWFDDFFHRGFAQVASDMHLRRISPLCHLALVGGDETTTRLICDVYTPDGQLPGDPRSVLRRG
jgi:glutamine synthetase